MLDIIAVGLVLIGIALLAILVAAALKPKTFQVERSIEIRASAEKVFGLIDDLNAMNGWNPFAEGHPREAITYSGPRRGKGAAYDWNIPGSPGEGRIEITDSSPPTSIDMSLVMKRPMHCRNQVRFGLQPTGGMTTVTWSMSGPCSYLQRVMGTLFSMDKMVGGMFEKGLASLKMRAEKA